MSFFWRLHRCRKAISIWKKSTVTNLEKLILELQVQIDEAQEDENVTDEALPELKWKLCEAYREDDLFWRLKGRALWLAEGDKNTNFFHASTKNQELETR